MTDRLAWIDVETTGLDPEEDRLLEVGCVITEPDLTVVAEMSGTLQLGIGEAARLPMDETVRAMHERSGLFAECRDLDLSYARPLGLEEALMKFLEDNSVGDSPMCGSSVHFDRSVLKYRMPELEQKFHYRNIDVSTIKELAGRWKPFVIGGLPEPQRLHRAIPDIHDTLAEAAHYKAWLFE